jgi:hypothetical protein
VLVLGMHRSGTSAFSGMLSQRGLFFGNNLIVGNEYNRKGFFEQSEVVILNERLLNKAGFEWHTVPGEAAAFLSPMERFFARAHIRRLVARIYGGHSVFAIKDPRLCVLLGLWESALTPRYDLHRVFVVRDPLEVSRSLERRNAFTLEKASFLWLVYNVACLEACGSKPDEIVAFQDVIATPDATIAPVASALGLDAVERKSAEPFIDPTLRHHHTEATVADRQRHPVVAAASDFYELLLRKRNDIDPTDIRVFAELLAKYREVL